MGFTFNRVAVMLVVAAAIGMTAIAMTEADYSLVAASAAVAVAFACNWPARLPRPIRLIAFAVQVLTIVVIAGGTLVMLSIAEAGARPTFGFWLIVAVSVFVAYRAASEGYALLNEQRPSRSFSRG
jgi:hypothetical protein